MNGAGAATMVCIQLYESLGAKHSNFMVFDRKGILYKGRPDVEELKLKFCVDEKYKDYDLAKALKDADVFIGLSVGDVVTADMVKNMAKPIVFAMANPTPEINYELAVASPQRHHHRPPGAGLSQPGEQRSRVSLYLPRSARCAGNADQRSHEAGCRKARPSSPLRHRFPIS